MLNVLSILVSAPCRRILLAAGMVAALAGCGQKGALYLPAGTAAPVATAASAPATPPVTGTASPVRMP